MVESSIGQFSIANPTFAEGSGGRVDGEVEYLFSRTRVSLLPAFFLLERHAIAKWIREDGYEYDDLSYVKQTLNNKHLKKTINYVLGRDHQEN